MGIGDLSFLREEALSSIIFFHGYGANPLALSEKVSHMALFQKFNWFFPRAFEEAPQGGFQWHNLYQPFLHKGSLTDYLYRVRQRTLKKIESLQLPQPWFLIGYSQGGFMALDLMLSQPDWFQGAAVLSGYALPLDYKKQLISKPLFFSYGKEDPICPGLFTVAASLQAQSVGCSSIQVKNFEGGHQVYLPHFQEILEHFS